MELGGSGLAPPRLLRARAASPVRLGSPDAHHAGLGLSLLRHRARRGRQRAGRGQLWQGTTLLREVEAHAGTGASYAAADREEHTMSYSRRSLLAVGAALT